MSEVDAMVTFVRARLDEDEELARAAGDDLPWTAVTDDTHGPRVDVDGHEAWSRQVSAEMWNCDDELDGCPEAAREWAAEAKHIARHNPARVLDEVAMKRSLLALADGAAAAEASPTEFERGRADAANLIVTALAYGYRDHPDYRQEWDK